MQNQQGDVLLFQTNDDGEIIVTDGIVKMTPAFETMVYLCMFGGNEDDDGSNNNPLTWWANKKETDPNKRYVSKTQNLLRSLPATSANLLALQEAVYSDLQVFIDANIASDIEVNVTIPELNKVNISGSIEANGIEAEFNFTENWRALQQ
jgi:hypothetical protein